MVSLLDDDASGFGNRVLSLLGNLVTGGRIGDPSVQRAPTAAGDPLGPVQSPVQRQSSLDALMSFGGALSQAGAGRYGPPVPLGVALNDAFSGARQSAVSDEVAAQAAIDAQLRRRILLRQEQQAEQANAILMQALPGLLGPPPQPTTPQGPPPGYTPGATLRGLLGAAEGGDRGYSAVNSGGYTGRYQVGSQLLADQGVYTPAEGEKPNAWGGTFNIPGFPQIKTRDDFLRTPAAQDAVFDSSMSHLSKALTDNGTFERGIGKTINGVPVTREGLLAGAWLGGATGIKNWVDSDGKHDPADANGTKLSQYVALGGHAATPAAPAQPQPTQYAGPGVPTGGTTVAYPGRPDADVSPGTTAAAPAQTATAPATAAPPAAAAPSAQGGGGTVGALPSGAQPVMPTSLPAMTQGVLATLPPAQKALVIAGLLDPRTRGATLVQLATKQPQMPMQLDTASGTFLLSPNGQITQVGGPKGAPQVQDFLVNGEHRRMQFDPVSRQWQDVGAVPVSPDRQVVQRNGQNVVLERSPDGSWHEMGQAEIPGSSQAKTPERQQQDITASTTGNRQTIQQGGKNVVIEKQQDGSWKTIGEAEIPGSSQPVTPERARQEAARTAQSQRVTIQLDGKNVEMQQQADGSWKPIGQAPVSTAQQEAGLAGQKAFDTERGKQVAERVAGYQKAAGEAQQAIDALTTMRRVQQDTPTGPLAPHLTAYGALASSLGINLGPIAQGLSPQSVAGAQAFSKLSAGLATHLIGANGFPSNSFSNADRQFVESMVPNLTNTPNANLLIGAFMQAQAQRVQQRATDYAAIKTKTPDSVEAWEQQWTRNNNANPIFREVSTPDEAKALPPNTIYHVKGQPLDKAWGLIGSGG